MTHWEGSCLRVSQVFPTMALLALKKKATPLLHRLLHIHITLFILRPHTMHATFALVMRCKRRFLDGKFHGAAFRDARAFSRNPWAKDWNGRTRVAANEGKIDLAITANVISNWIISNAKTRLVSQSSGNGDPIILRCTVLSRRCFPFRIVPDRLFFRSQ